MRKRTFILILVSVFLFCTDHLVNAEPSSKGDGNKVEFLKINTGNNHRPELPSRIFIECHYCQGKLSFVLSHHSNIHNMDVILERDECVVCFGHVTRENPEVAIPVLFGEYDITCRTDGNQIFKGKLNFE